MTKTITLRAPLGSRQYRLYPSTTVETLIHAAVIDDLADASDVLEIVRDGQVLTSLDAVPDGAILHLLATGSAV